MEKVAISHFTPYQLQILNLMSRVKDDQQMKEICELLSNYFAQKAIEEADKLWNEGNISYDTIEEWKHEHIF